MPRTRRPVHHLHLHLHPHLHLHLVCIHIGCICLSKVLMNCVDTGWVTDNAPGGVGAVAQTHATFIAAPLDEDDGAARVRDP